MSNKPADRRQQRGLVLILLAVMLILLSSVYYFSGISLLQSRVDDQRQNREVLKQAKQALLAYAASYHDVKYRGEFGFLPCPDYNNGLNEGIEDSGNCGSRSVSRLGYLPWRSLGIEPLKDASGNCLLYAVTGEYKNDDSGTARKSAMLNEDSYGMFQLLDDAGNIIEGASADERVVAVVMAPGGALDYQARNVSAGTHCAGDYTNFSAYLDSAGSVDNSAVQANPDSLDDFISAWPGSELTVNDEIITIGREELWQVIMQRKELDAAVSGGESMARRITEALAQCMAQYVNDNSQKRLPYAAPMNLAGADYRLNNSYSDADGVFLGRFPYSVSASDAQIAGATAPAELFDKGFASPQRECDDLQIEFPSGEDANLRDADSTDRRFWENWKDHFFYVVSKEYQPGMGMIPSPPRCGDCITVSGTQYAAAVIFSGSRLSGQTRDYPIAAADSLNTKGEVDNYLEMTNLRFDGVGDFTPTDNDYVFCLTDDDPVQVVVCQ